MEGFNELLLKLRDVHEQEVERWQVKVQELSNKKGCDSKRMEELFTRNQQMKEQQRLLTENIKTLENRLRAGLCDRCTVTQEVAKRRQQEFEVLQMQSLQHITLLAGEMTNLKKENKRLRDEIVTLRATLNNNEHSSNSSTTMDVKPSSPELSPIALITTAISRATGQPVDGDVAVKTEADHQTEESEQRQLKGVNRGHFPLSLSTYISPSWKTGLGTTTAAERRSHTVEGLGQRTSVHQTIPAQRPSSSGSGEVNPGRHVLHAPVPCRPHPIVNGSVPWKLSEPSDWISAASAGSNMAVQLPSKSNLPHYPNLIPTSQHESHSSPRRQVFVSPWQSSPQPPTKEPTVVFRVRSLSEHTGIQVKPQNRREVVPDKAERVSGEGFKDVCEGPLDLSDRGKSVSSQSPRGDSPTPSQGGERLEKTIEKNVKPNITATVAVSSPSLTISPSSSVLSLKQEEDSAVDQNHKVIKEQDQTEEVNGKADQSNGKKLPVLSLSFCPVVVLETLNPALQKHDSPTASGKSSSPAAESGSRSEEQEEEEEEDKEETMSRPETNQGCKRKRVSMETEIHRDSDTDDTAQERKVMVTMRTGAKHSDAV